MTHSLFDYIARDDDAPIVAGRQALALASKRIAERFDAFLTGKTAAEGTARLELIREDFDAVVASACEEVGYEDSGSLTRTLWNDRISRLSGENPFAKKDDDKDEKKCDCEGDEECAKCKKDDGDKDKKKFPFDKKDSPRTASTHESRKPKLCPYHNEVMGISLAQGEPAAGYNAMASHAWTGKHCQGDEYEGARCNFKPEMTTQSYWDAKAEKAEQRREERELQQAEVPVEQTIGEPTDEAIGTLEDGFEVEQIDTLEGGEAEVDAGLPAEELMAVAASTKRFLPLAPKQAEALEHQDVTKNTHPEFTKEHSHTDEPPDSEMPGSPHPTERIDIQPPITEPRHNPTNEDKLEDIGEQVTEHQDVTQDSEFSNKYPNRWASIDGAIADFNKTGGPAAIPGAEPVHGTPHATVPGWVWDKMEGRYVKRDQMTPGNGMQTYAPPRPTTRAPAGSGFDFMASTN